MKNVLLINIILFFGTASVWGQWSSFLTNNSSTDRINSIVTEGNTVWAATNGGVVKWNTLTGTNSIFPLDDIPEYGKSIHCAAIDWNGQKWFGGNGRIYVYNDTTWFSFNENNIDLLKNISKINSIAVDNVNKRIIFAIYSPSFSGDIYYLISLISYDGMKWEKLISFNQGVFWNEYILMDTVNPWNILGFGDAEFINYFNKKDQGYILDRTRLNVDTAIQSIAIDVDNRIWVSAMKTIYLWDRTGLSPTPFGQEITGTIGLVKNIFVDKNRVKWFGSDEALVRYDNKTWSVYPFQKLNEFDHSSALAVDEKGDVWMGRGGDYGYGLWRFHPPVTGVIKNYSLPLAVKIYGNSPNPFNPSTTISFTLSAPGKTELSVYSATGQRVRTLVSGDLSVGKHSVVWDGRDYSGKPLSSGVYFSRLSEGKYTASNKMLLLR